MHEVYNEYQELSRKIGRYVTDTSLFLDNAIRSGKKCFFEGAQGSLLDVDLGTYPFVTSSNTVAGQAATGSGIGPTKIDTVIGVTKAYATRVGEGPFPSEITGEEGEKLRELGEEYGATTGRPRRCGWLDIVALRYAVRINGLEGLIMTKLDVLDNVKEIKGLHLLQAGRQNHKRLSVRDKHTFRMRACAMKPSPAGRPRLRA